MQGESSRRKGRLILQDGRSFEGYAFGADCVAAGEVVFNTGMVGYPESLTDPSYAGQILTLTYTLIGNYGVPSGERDEHGIVRHFESECIQIRALVVADISAHYSHHRAVQSLSDWLAAQGVPGLTGIDTRAVTKHIRTAGVMPAKVVPEGCDEQSVEFVDPNRSDLVGQVTRDSPATHGDGDVHIAVVDCGIKNNIMRELLRRRVKLTVVPASYDLSTLDYDGLLLSNGPGDPTRAGAVIANVAAALRDERPVFGICLGAQILALAAGARTYKLKYGHRGQNQPCTDQQSGRCYITSQNHGFAVDHESLPRGWQPWFRNANDGTCEGIHHESKPFSAVQFHPEATCGPVDTVYLLDRFVRQVREAAGRAAP